MKKILLTTSALTMLAGAAAADLSMSGDGRMGVTTSGGVTATEYRYRVHFNASGETDGGLTFGAKAGMRWDEAAFTAAYGSQVWMGNGSMKVRVGNTGGAIASSSGAWGTQWVGFSGMSFSAVGPFFWTSSSTAGAGPNIVAVDFSLGSANMTVSGSTGGNTEVAANFAVGSSTIGIGFDDGLGATGGYVLTAGFDAGSGNVHVNLFQTSGGTLSWSLAAKMAAGSGSVNGYVANISGSSNFGLGYNQSLGGGATAGVGVESIAGTTRVEAGVSFSF
jgi:outer membrane protein OmpU